MKHMKPELMHIHAGSQTIPWDHFWNCHVVDLFLNWSSSETHLSGLSLKKNPACETSHKIQRWRMMMWKTKRICEIYFKRGSWRYDSEASAAPVRLQKATTGLLQHAADPRMIRTWSEHEWRPFPCPRDSIWIVVFECLLKCGFYEKTHAFFRPQLLQTAFWGWDTAKRMKLRNRSISARPLKVAS